MKIIHFDGLHGVLWYSASDYRGETVHVVVYGLEHKQFDCAETAAHEFNSCMMHALECEVAYDENN